MHEHLNDNMFLFVDSDMRTFLVVKELAKNLNNLVDKMTWIWMMNLTMTTTIRLYMCSPHPHLSTFHIAPCV